MKVQVAELTDYALDWAVEFTNGTHWVNGYFCYPKDDPDFSYPFTRQTRKYSSKWEHGGPILDRFMIGTQPIGSKQEWAAGTRYYDIESQFYTGPTILVAGMRCYVAHKLGNEIEIPDELM